MLLLTIVLLVQLHCITCANILFVEPVPSPSHHIWNKALSMALVERGHNVTVITHDKDKEVLPKNYTPILFEGIYEELFKAFNLSELVEDTNPFHISQEMLDWCAWTCNYDLQTKGLEQLLNYPKDFKFDLIIFDFTTGQCLYPLIERFNFPPAIAVTAFLLPPYNSIGFGNHIHPSYIPFFATQYTDKMDFMERFWNFLYVSYNIYKWRTDYFNNQTALARKKFGNHIKTVEEMENHFSFLLCNTDPILDYPQPLPPNIIPVGGLHARPPKPLPEDLEKIVSNAKNGFIIFSLGTNVRSDLLGEDIIQTLVKVFEDLAPTIVLWKFESDYLKNLPKNLVIRKWLPINDLLGHPNVKLFVTHGGALSTQESMYHGVPIVGIPFFADQHVNLKRMITKNFGKVVNLEELDYTTLHTAITTVLNDPLYARSIKAVSRIFRDQPQTPLQRAVFYVEFTIRHGGAHFFNLASRHMPFYKAASIDVLLFILFCILIIVFIILKCVKRFLSPSKPKRKIKKN